MDGVNIAENLLRAYCVFIVDLIQCGQTEYYFRKEILVGMKMRVRQMLSSFRDIFNFGDEDAKGRSIGLISSLLTTIYNVFITGIFYTGFLSMYDMSITDTGILTFVPYIANLLSIFSPKLLGRFQRRKGVLLVAKTIYYAVYIVLATIMPQFVKDPGARLTCFIVIIALSSGFYALFSSGITTWFYNFYPKETDKRTSYLAISQIFQSTVSSITLIGCSFLTDALANSPYQDTLILIFRYFAFFLVLVDVFVQTKAYEYPYGKEDEAKLTDVFVLPFREKKFLACMALMFVWNFMANLNNGLWNYHLLNHMGFSYTLINIVAVMYTLVLILLSPMWQKVLRLNSWVKTFGIAVLLAAPVEFFYFFMTPETAFIYVPNTIYAHVVSVGLNIAYANILYMNLPMEKTTAYICFHTLGCNVFAFLGLMTGTMISSVTGDTTTYMFGMDLYSVQFTLLLKALMNVIMGLLLVTQWRKFTPQVMIEETELIRAVTKKRRGL